MDYQFFAEALLFLLQKLIFKKALKKLSNSFAHGLKKYIAVNEKCKQKCLTGNSRHKVKIYLIFPKF